MSRQNPGFFSSSSSSNGTQAESGQADNSQTSWSSSNIQQKSSQDQNKRNPSSGNIWDREVDYVFVEQAEIAAREWEAEGFKF